VDFNFSNSGQISVNKITGANSSHIYGHIIQSGAGGTVYLINASGVLFGKNSSVNLNSFAVSTYNLNAQDIQNKKFLFSGLSSGTIQNKGMIKVQEGGFATFLAPVIENTGTINAPEGTLALISGKNITLNMNDGQQISLELDKSLINDLVIENNKTQIQNVGILKADGGKIFIQADKINSLISNVVNNTGIIEANTLTKQNGKIVFGNIDINGETGLLASTGKINTTGEQGGNIKISSSSVSLGGTVDASGKQGGNIQVNATSTLSLAENIKAVGSSDSGGNVNIHSGNTFEISSSKIDASGKTGGTLTHIADKQIFSSGTYTAKGTQNSGGEISISAPVIKLLSSKIDASGKAKGGNILIGGEYQGGKNLTEDVIPNADYLFVSSGSEIKANGTQDKGGQVVLWADDKNLYFGNTFAKNGGTIEVSSGGDKLQFAGKADAGKNGNLLLDPKNINYVDSSGSISSLQYNAITGVGYTGGNNTNMSDSGSLNVSDNFGFSVALDGNRLAVGSPLDDGNTNSLGNSGTVYLFSFADSAFNGGVLEGLIGKGYTGGKNIDMTASLETNDQFGTSLSLDGNRLAVGAQYDDGNANSLANSGAVYLFSFADSAFNGGSLEATIGKGYTGGKNIDMTAYLGTTDYFGHSVSLDGNRLAVGAHYDDGSANSLTDSGAVYLFSFVDSVFTDGNLEGRIGKGYTGGKNFDMTAYLAASDYFGQAVSLDGNRLAISANYDDGNANSLTDSGAVYLFSFTDSVFTDGNLEGTIGKGYTGGKNIDMTAYLDTTDVFGSSVSLDGNKIAVGAHLDDGSGNSLTSAGAVYLFTFDDTAFTNGSLQGTIGKGYSGAKDIDITAYTGADYFGYSVSLDGNRLASGAYLDDAAGGNLTDAGAVYLFNFSDSAFSGGVLTRIIGKGYNDNNEINLLTGAYSAASDNFGVALSLDGTRLAVGAQSDDGSGNSLTDAGSVYLYTFTDSAFSGGSLEGIIGKGYSGGKNIDMTAYLGASDYFGRAVSLDGNRLAVGAYGDDGSYNSLTNSGAVYLFSFADSAFSGGSLEGTIGKGYTLGKNIDMTAYLGTTDYFGFSVSLDGNRLAVGAHYDDGSANSLANSGAVYLFTFADSVFTDGNLEGRIGKGYVGAKDIDITANLSVNDYFGTSVSLDGNRLATGAYADDGVAPLVTDTGAVYLFTFNDSAFTGGSLQGIIGKGYIGAKDVDLTSNLHTLDYLGQSVSLDGNRLAVGAINDDGFGVTSTANIGAVYLFTFTDSAFTGGSLQGTIGSNYVGGKNINLKTSYLNNNDCFGTSVSLDGNNLAVGAYGDDGYQDVTTDVGAVYLFTFSDNSFSGGNLEGLVGQAYNPGFINSAVKKIDMSSYFGASDSFGNAVSLDGNRLAVGAYADDGVTNALANSGAVYLYTFADSAFNGGSLQSIIGAGYAGGKNIDLTANLATTDYFGYSVSLDGNRLAVGAQRDDGVAPLVTDAGAVYLFTFADDVFTGGSLQSTIGKGYIGAKDINIAANLAASDYFGTSVSLDGNRLAVGASRDDGFGVALTDSGAVYLFTFADDVFTGGSLQATIGKGYAGAKDINIAANLTASDYFGQSVALDGNRLAVGAYLDDGSGNSLTDSGAVHLFKFNDSVFTGGTYQGTIGNGYSGGKNIDITSSLAINDNFGYSVSLDGNMLAVGAIGDDASDNYWTNPGAVYLFTFNDSVFTGGSLQGTIGKNYSGGKNTDMTVYLDASDQFGASVSLNSNRLAVGANLDDSFLAGSSDSGAVYLFNFVDSTFAGGNLVEQIGYGYTKGNNINTIAGNHLSLDSSDNLARSVSLDGNRLAVGAYFDDGFDNSLPGSGAVYLFSFTDADFAGGTLEALIGKGYSGGKNIDLTAYLDKNDYFGNSVALDGNRLAVGTYADDGAGNILTDAGAVYLFTFADSVFNGGNLEGRIGKGYTGFKDINITASLATASDYFGSSVSLDGNRLAVGAYGDDGNANSMTDSGAVYLFTFADSVFTDGSFQGTIGKGYIGVKDIDITSSLGISDYFGQSLSLDSNRLAVGSYGDDNLTNTLAGSGNVYLFTFNDDVFSGGSLQSTIGAGYTGGKNIDMATYLDASDQFGYSVALDGNRLAVGAAGITGNTGDDGAGNTLADSGTVYLFTFADSVFNGGNLEGRIGKGYSGGKNIDMAPYLANDYFGVSVSLNGNRLAVGAIGDDGLGNYLAESGAVYLFNFSDSAFTDGVLKTRIGNKYSGVLGLNISSGLYLDPSDYFGRSVSLDGTQLAIGAYGDDGFGNAITDAGAVYLYTFADKAFNGGSLQSIIGSGYAGGKNIDMSEHLGASDYFGQSVSLDGNRLAVGANYDDGLANALADSGAVYLFSFADSAFTGGNLEGRIGKGYTGAKNIDITAYIGATDYFGTSVSLNGNRLAVGSYADDGIAPLVTDAGAVYLFTFSDSVFADGALQGIIGKGYTGVKDIDMSAYLDASDYFGLSVSLDGNRLAVGAQNDDGNANSLSNSGAVYLFSFADSVFTGGNLEGRIGKGYTGAKDTDMTSYLGATDYFGVSAFLDENKLAVSAHYDDGNANSLADSGAVYLFNFSDSAFNGGIVNARIGKGYTGGKNIDMTGCLDTTDYFGVSVSLNENRLAVGAHYDDGSGTGTDLGLTNAGAAYLFVLDKNDSSYDQYQSGDYTITRPILEALLSSPQNVTLQANNDINMNAALNANNLSGNGGILTLQAGRSINLNNDITTDSGNLILIANDDLANGVVDAQRDAGIAGITMASGTSINAGAGSVTMELKQGTGKTNAESGDITLSNISAGSVLIKNNGPTAGSDIIIQAGSQLNASDAGNNLVLSTVNGNFINNSDSNALISNAGSWIVYSSDPSNTVKNGLASNKFYNKTYAINAPDSFAAGNYMLFSIAPALTITADDKSKTYGDANPAFTYTCSGLIDGDTEGIAVSGLLSSAAAQNSNAGNYSILQGALSSPLDYQINFTEGALTINQKNLLIKANNNSKTYGDANPLFDSTFTGLIASDFPADFSLTYTLAGSPVNAGAYNNSIVPSALSGAKSSNYNVTAYETGDFTINQKALTIVADDKSKTYGDINPVFTGTVAGLTNGDSEGDIGVNYSTPAILTSNVGSYNIIPSIISANYNPVFTNGTLTINQKNLLIKANDNSKTYGESNPLFDSTFTGLIDSDFPADFSLTYTLAGSPVKVGTYNNSIVPSALSGAKSFNYNVTAYETGNFIIDPKPVVVIDTIPLHATDPAIPLQNIVPNINNSQVNAFINKFNDKLIKQEKSYFEFKEILNSDKNEKLIPVKDKKKKYLY